MLGFDLRDFCAVFIEEKYNIGVIFCATIFSFVKKQLSILPTGVCVIDDRYAR